MWLNSTFVHRLSAAAPLCHRTLHFTPLLNTQTHFESTPIPKFFTELIHTSFQGWISLRRPTEIWSFKNSTRPYEWWPATNRPQAVANGKWRTLYPWMNTVRKLGKRNICADLG